MSREPAPPANIFLIGYRATGKSTVARLVAEALAWSWCDADEILERQAGRSIRDIFAKEGEAGFRVREARVLEELCQLHCHVIATGGGVVLAKENRAKLQAAGLAIWLRADAETLCKRLSQDIRTPERRPNLTVGGLAEIQELLRVREPLYDRCADWKIETALRTPAEVSAAIVAYWRKLHPEVKRMES
jgi:shikimate kinase